MGDFVIVVTVGNIEDGPRGYDRRIVGPFPDKMSADLWGLNTLPATVHWEVEKLIDRQSVELSMRVPRIYGLSGVVDR